MDKDNILEIVKAKLGIRTGVRDDFLEAIIGGVLDEIEIEKGIKLDPENNNHLMFVVDLSSWRYQGRDEKGDMPKHLMWRYRNLYVSSKGGGDV